MKVILMRHGQAEALKTTDSARQLTEFGQQQAKESAKYLMDKYQPDLFIVSPYKRAKQTLQAFVDIAPNTPVQIVDSITPDDDATQGLDKVAQVVEARGGVDCVLVVCHMPIVANMAGLLLKQWATSYSLAETRVIECEVIAENLGEQIDSYVPVQR